mmetsp:Transcript_8483/g.19153  ORF Transcript_8483/g.19153 Transcript_8483/m.19153 type:complete len:154 (+) Transcript_8483:413-874(+)
MYSREYTWAGRDMNANHAWYRMMNFLFSELQQQEALFVEEDVVVSYDALLVTGSMLQEKWKRQTATKPHPQPLHALCLGGNRGENKINPELDTFVAFCARFFQPMAYSLSKDVFETIDRNRKKCRNRIADWAEEITAKNSFPTSHLFRPVHRA